MKSFFKRFIKQRRKYDKEISYFAAAYNGWIQTRLEQDKSILILSTSAIGFLVTLLIAQDSVVLIDLILFVIATLAFAMSSLITIHIFEKNANLLEAISQDLTTDKATKELKKFDRWKKFFFYLGIIFTFLIALYYGFKKIGEDKMTKQKQAEKKTIVYDKQKSLNGFQNLKPGSENKPKESNDSTKRIEKKK